MEKNTKKLIKTGFQKAGFFLGEKQEEGFFIYLEELKKWNRKISLTSLKDDNNIVENLFVNSLLYAHFISPGSGLKVLDLGSGAGFPGIPIKIFSPEVSMTLLEASQKKTAFLKHICRILKLKDIECLAERSERLAKKRAGFYDIIVTRGTGPIKRFEKESLPLLKKGGAFIAQRGLKGGLEKEGESLRLMETKIYKDRRFALAVFKNCSG